MISLELTKQCILAQHVLLEIIPKDNSIFDQSLLALMLSELFQRVQINLLKVLLRQFGVRVLFPKKVKHFLDVSHDLEKNFYKLKLSVQNFFLVDPVDQRQFEPPMVLLLRNQFFNFQGFLAIRILRLLVLFAKIKDV